MKKLLRSLAILVFLSILILPALFKASVPFLDQLTNVKAKIELLKVYLASSAFITAVFALYVKESRFKAQSENVLASLIISIVSDAILGLSLVLPEGGDGFLSGVGFYTLYLSLLLYLISLGGLFFYTFLRTYNHVFNLRTDQVWKFFKPVRAIRNFLSPDHTYEFQPVDRKPQVSYLKDVEQVFSKPEIEHIMIGTSILIMAEESAQFRKWISDVALIGVQNGQTVNYVCADKHPLQTWKNLLKHNPDLSNYSQDIVFVDAYSESYAFTDDIQWENSSILKKDGVESVSSKCFAGLHTAVAKAFNVIKKKEEDKGKGKRRPMLMVYEKTSYLSIFEGVEQFQIFWRHVIASERSYGMLTIILEDSRTPKEMIDTLFQSVDFALEVDTPDRAKEVNFCDLVTRLK